MRAYVTLHHDDQGLYVVWCRVEAHRVYEGRNVSMAYRTFKNHIARHKDPVRYAEQAAQQRAIIRSRPGYLIRQPTVNDGQPPPF